jgi:hypothetical protein
MRNQLPGDRVDAANRIDLGARTFKRGDDTTELIEVVGDREDAPFRQNFPGS